jgi:excisionase family DNA binding protein
MPRTQPINTEGTGPVVAPNAITIADFTPGTLHQSGRVCRVFGVTRQTLRNWIRRGRIHARQVPGSTIYLFAGEEVQRFYATLAAVPGVVAPPTPAQERQQAERAAKRLAKKRIRTRGQT